MRQWLSERWLSAFNALVERGLQYAMGIGLGLVVLLAVVLSPPVFALLVFFALSAGSALRATLAKKKNAVSRARGSLRSEEFQISSVAA